MIAITRDAAWAVRLDDLSSRGGWSFAAIDALPSSSGSMSDSGLIVLDRALAGATPSRAVAGLRGLFPNAHVVLACCDADLSVDAIAAGLQSGADEVIQKSWSDARLSALFASRRDAVLASAVRVSADGNLKAEMRSRRVFLKSRSRWSELAVPPAEFAILWCLLEAGEEAVPRARLLEELSALSGRDVEYETVSRRALSLRRALSPWKGTLESVRGGYYRLTSSARRRSTT